MRQLKIQKSITNRTEEDLNQYLTEIARIPMISPEEESELAHEVKLGGVKGKRAKDKLIKANLRFVVSVAKQYQHRGMTLSDLINEGNIGLVKATEKYDETRGFKFISYAVWWIRQSILQAMAEQGRLVRVPLNHVSNIQVINQAIAKFEQEHHRKPSSEELAEFTKIDLDKIDQAIQAESHEVSIDVPMGEDSDTSYGDTIVASSNESNPEHYSERESMVTEVIAIMDRVLKPRERQIICDTYGIGVPQRNPEEISNAYGLTRERVRQIREKGIQKIRNSVYAKYLTKYLG